MSKIDFSKPVLVTGANGYVASWLVKQLLEVGFTVHAAVRNPENKEKPKIPSIYIFFLLNNLDINPKLIIPIAEEIEKTVKTQDVTELEVEKKFSISENEIVIMPISIVNKLVAKHIKHSVIIFFFVFIYIIKI